MRCKNFKGQTLPSDPGLPMPRKIDKAEFPAADMNMTNLEQERTCESVQIRNCPDWGPGH